MANGNVSQDAIRRLVEELVRNPSAETDIGGYGAGTVLEDAESPQVFEKAAEGAEKFTGKYDDRAMEEIGNGDPDLDESGLNESMLQRIIKKIIEGKIPQDVEEPVHDGDGMYISPTGAANAAKKYLRN